MENKTNKEIDSQKIVKQETQTEIKNTVEVKIDKLEPVKELVQNDFNIHCPCCNVKLNVNVKNKKLTLIK